MRVIKINYCDECPYVRFRPADKWIEIDVEYDCYDEDIQSILPTLCFCYKSVNRKRGRLIKNLGTEHFQLAGALTVKEIEEKEAANNFNLSKDTWLINYDSPIPKVEIPEWCPLKKL